VASPLASLKADVNEALAQGGLPTIPADGGGGGATDAPPTEAPPPDGGTGTDSPPTPTPDGGGGVVIPGLGTPIDGTLKAGTSPIAFDGTAFLTDFLFSNPNGRSGAIIVLRNDTELMRLRLENFRDYDVHFVTPIVIGPEDRLGLSLVCEGGGTCDPAVLYSGYLRP
jgi:hypothetical protein